ncbi:MAG: M50 family metallopeptidase [Negativicutes bacterium]|nr:M50 family metallopeptidase [Negativicutes bacterium]
MRAGKVAGVQFILNNWFIALIVVFALMGMGFKVLGVFAAVLWHELAHAAVATSLGYRVRELELLPFGGVARIERIGEAGSISEIIMAAAGPLASLVMAAVIYFIAFRVPAWTVTLDFYLRANLMLALFNLLPGLPLDGGRILRALLATRWDFTSATGMVVNTGKLISLGLAAVSALDLWLTGTFNLTFFAAAVFLYAAARTETAVAGFRTMRVLANKKAELVARGILPTNHFTALDSVTARDILRFFGPEQYHIVLVVDKQLHLQGTLTETQVWEALPLMGLYARIGDFLPCRKV